MTNNSTTLKDILKKNLLPLMDDEYFDEALAQIEAYTARKEVEARLGVFMMLPYKGNDIYGYSTSTVRGVVKELKAKLNH